MARRFNRLTIFACLLALLMADSWAAGVSYPPSGPSKITVFTSDGTFTRDPRTVFDDVFVFGAGAGGGSGARRASGAAASGGGGGGGGASQNGAASGTGGNGGDGLVLVFEYF